MYVCSSMGPSTSPCREGCGNQYPLEYEAKWGVEGRARSHGADKYVACSCWQQGSAVPAAPPLVACRRASFWRARLPLVRRPHERRLALPPLLAVLVVVRHINSSALSWVVGSSGEK